MLPRGRPPGPGTAEEKAAIRREKVRLNVKAYRERKKNASTQVAPTPSSSEPSPFSSSPSSSEGRRNSHDQNSTENDEEDEDAPTPQIVVRSKSQVPSKPKQSEMVVAPTLVTENTIYNVPNAGPEYTTALLSIFRHAFLPSTVQLPTASPGSSLLVTPCSPWIINAYNMALQQDSGALKSGLVAVGLILSGLQNGNSDLKVASFNMHRQALSQLRTDLQPITLRHRKRTTTSVISPYLACLAVTMFEMIQTGFSENILQHLKALNSLIELIYNDSAVEPFMADLIMEDFGMLEMIFCLRYGLNSVLRNTRKKWSRKRGKAASSDQKRNASVYGDILDIVEELPSLILRVQAIDGNTCSEEAFDDLQQLIRKVIRIQGDLDAWNMYFEVRHSSVMMQEDFMDDATGRRGTRLRLRSYEHGAVGLFMVTYQLYALDANIEATIKLTQMHRMRVSQAKQSPFGSPSEVNQVSPDEVPLSSRDSQSSAVGSNIHSYNEKGFLHEQLKQQRAKLRVVVMQLIELMNQFESMCISVTGQALLILPCDKIKIVLDSEEARLGDDLRTLQPGDHEGAIAVNKYMKVLKQAREIFHDVEQRVRHGDLSSS